MPRSARLPGRSGALAEEYGSRRTRATCSDPVIVEPVAVAVAVAVAALTRAPRGRSRHIPWSILVRRTFDVIGAACPTCGRGMDLRAVVRGPGTGRVLAGLERAARGPPARVPVVAGTGSAAGGSDGDGGVRLQGRGVPRMRRTGANSRGIQRSRRPRGDPEAAIQGVWEQLDAAAKALMFPIPSQRASPGLVQPPPGRVTFSGPSRLDSPIDSGLRVSNKAVEPRD